MSVILNSPNVVIGHMSGGTININNCATAEQQAKKDRPVCEDIEPVQEQQERNCPFVVAEKLRELNLYTYEEFVHMYRKAAETDAKTLAEFLTKYRQLGVLDFKNYEKKEILERLQAYFPTMKKYSYSNFIYYF